MMNKALFLDRDGIINVDFGYVHKKEHIVFVENIFPLVRDRQPKRISGHHHTTIRPASAEGIIPKKISLPLCTGCRSNFKNMAPLSMMFSTALSIPFMDRPLQAGEFPAQTASGHDHAGSGKI